MRYLAVSTNLLQGDDLGGCDAIVGSNIGADGKGIGILPELGGLDEGGGLGIRLAREKADHNNFALLNL